MIDNIPYDYQHWQFMGWTGGLLASAVVISIGYAVWAKRRKEQQESSVKEMLGVSDLSNSLDTKHEGQHAGRAADTLFIMPDISNYTRFVSSKHLEADDAQNIIFSLMSAIINTVGEELRFSKLEGDSALFLRTLMPHRRKRLAAPCFRFLPSSMLGRPSWSGSWHMTR